MTSLINSIPVVGSVARTGVGVYNTASGISEVKSNIREAKKQGIIKTSLGVSRGLTQTSQGIQQIAKNLPKVAHDLNKVAHMIGVDSVKGLTVEQSLEHIHKHIEKSKDRWAILGVINEIKGTARTGYNSWERLKRFFIRTGAKIKTGLQAVKEVTKDAIYFDATGELMSARNGKLFKFTDSGAIETDPNTVKTLIRFDNYLNLLSQQAEKQKVYKDDEENRYIFVKHGYSGSIELKKIFDGKTYSFVDEIVEGEYPELIPIGKSLQQADKDWSLLINETDEIQESLKQGKYTTAQAIEKEARVREMERLLNKDPRFETYIDKNIAMRIVDRALTLGMQPNMIEGILNNKVDINTKNYQLFEILISLDLKDKSNEEKKKEITRALKLNGFNVEKLLRDYEISFEKLLKLQKKLSLLKSGLEDYDPTLLKDIGIVDTLNFTSFAAGLIELFSTMPLATFIGSGLTLILLYLSSKLLKTTVSKTYDILSNAFWALWNYVRGTKAYKTQSSELPPPEKLEIIPKREILVNIEEFSDTDYWFDYYRRFYPKSFNELYNSYKTQLYMKSAKRIKKLKPIPPGFEDPNYPKLAKLNNTFIKPISSLTSKKVRAKMLKESKTSLTAYSSALDDIVMPSITDFPGVEEEPIDLGASKELVNVFTDANEVIEEEPIIELTPQQVKIMRAVRRKNIFIEPLPIPPLPEVGEIDNVFIPQPKIQTQARVEARRFGKNNSVGERLSEVPLPKVNYFVPEPLEYPPLPEVEELDNVFIPQPKKLTESRVEARKFEKNNSVAERLNKVNLPLVDSGKKRRESFSSEENPKRLRIDDQKKLNMPPKKKPGPGRKLKYSEKYCLYQFEHSKNREKKEFWGNYLHKHYGYNVYENPMDDPNIRRSIEGIQQYLAEQDLPQPAPPAPPPPVIENRQAALIPIVEEIEDDLYTPPGIGTVTSSEDFQELAVVPLRRNKKKKRKSKYPPIEKRLKRKYGIPLSHPLPRKVDTLPLSVPMSLPPIVENTTPFYEKKIDFNSLVNLPLVPRFPSQITPSLKNFMPEDPDPNVSIDAFNPPPYVYKTPKQMDHYSDQSKQFGLKRKWEIGSDWVRQNVRR